MLKKLSTILMALIMIVIMTGTLAGCGDEEKDVESLEDMNTPDYHLALLSGTTADFQAQEKLPECSFEYMNSNSDAQAAVQSGKVDGYAFDSTNLERFVNANDGVELLDFNLGKAYIFAQFKKGNTEMTEAFNAFVEDLKEDGTLAKMETYWIEDCNEAMPDLSQLKPDEVQGTLVIATEALCEPYTFVGDNGRVVGFDIELGTRFAYHLGMDVKVDNMTFNALMPALSSGKADIALCEISSPASEVDSPDVEFSKPYKECNTAIVVKGEEKSFWSDIKDRFVASFITDHRWKLIVQGLGMTMLVSVAAFIVGAIWGGVLCAMRRSKRKLLRGIEKVYSTIIMGLPIMMMLLIFYYLIFASVNIPAAIVAIIAFALTEGATFCSMYDTGIESVDPQQYEAGLALGFRPAEAFARIVIPQAAKTIYPLFCNEFTNLIKATAIVGYIAIVDLTKASDIIRSRSFDAFFPMISTAIIYFIIIYLSLIILRKLGEKNLTDKHRTIVAAKDAGTSAEGGRLKFERKEHASFEPVISIRNLSKSYGDNKVLEGITRDIFPGEVVSIIGPSGCGKSTLIRTFNRMTDATEGTVVVDGEDIYAPGANVCAIRQKMGMVFQSYNLFPNMTCAENIMLGPVKIRKMDPGEARAKALMLLDSVGMEAYADGYPESLSGGQKQRVAIARALAMEPEIILFDEPTSALDPNMSVEVFNVIRALAEQGTTMVVVTHSMEFAESISSRVFYMDEKGIYEDDTPDVIFNSPKGEKTREFIYRTKTLTETLTRNMDLYGFQTEVAKFLTKRVMTRKRINMVNVICEEILYNMIFDGDYDGEAEVAISHSDVNGEVTIGFRSENMCEQLLKKRMADRKNDVSVILVNNMISDYEIEDGSLVLTVKHDGEQ